MKKVLIFILLLTYISALQSQQKKSRVGDASKSAVENNFLNKLFGVKKENSNKKRSKKKRKGKKYKYTGKKAQNKANDFFNKALKGVVNKKKLQYFVKNAEKPVVDILAVESLSYLAKAKLAKQRADSIVGNSNNKLFNIKTFSKLSYENKKNTLRNFADNLSLLKKKLKPLDWNRLYALTHNTYSTFLESKNRARSKQKSDKEREAQTKALIESLSKKNKVLEKTVDKLEQKRDLDSDNLLENYISKQEHNKEMEKLIAEISENMISETEHENQLVALYKKNHQNTASMKKEFEDKLEKIKSDAEKNSIKSLVFRMDVSATRDFDTSRNSFQGAGFGFYSPNYFNGVGIGIVGEFMFEQVYTGIGISYKKNINSHKLFTSISTGVHSFINYRNSVNYYNPSKSGFGDEWAIKSIFSLKGKQYEIYFDHLYYKNCINFLHFHTEILGKHNSVKAGIVFDAFGLGGKLEYEITKNFSVYISIKKNIIGNVIDYNIYQKELMGDFGLKLIID